MHFYQPCKNYQIGRLYGHFACYLIELIAVSLNFTSKITSKINVFEKKSGKNKLHPLT